MSAGACVWWGPIAIQSDPIPYVEIGKECRGAMALFSYSE